MDKNKIIEAAAKLVAKGAYDKAIKEYQKVLEADPKDVRILQKMGELYQKKNDNVQAAVYFTKVAESYATDGFFLKAVALYKQVLKLDPTLMDVNIKLAELHQQLQLLGEAMAYYQIVANHYDKSGDVKRSLDVLKKMVDLDPDNVPSRVKLADLYVREGMPGEAIGEFQRAAEHLKRQNRTDDYVRVAERISSLDPSNLALAKELAELYLQRNDQKHALAKLQICFKADSRDIDTLRLLAVAFQGLGQTSKTISVYKELARAYEERGQNAEAEQVWAQVAALDPNDPDVVARSTSRPISSPAIVTGRTGSSGAHLAPPPPPRSNSGQQPAMAPPQPPPSTGTQAVIKGKPDNISKLLTETDVYVKYGLHDKALEHLRKIFGSDPENIDAHEKAYQIYVASNNHVQAFEQLLNVLRLHTRRGDAPRAQPFLATILQQSPGHPEVPAFLAALRIAGATAQNPGHSLDGTDLPEDAILVDSSDDEVIVADEPADVISGESAALEDGVVVPEDDAMVLDPDDAAEAAAMAVEPPPVAETQFGSDFNADYGAGEPEPEEPVYADENEPDTGEHSVGEDEEPKTDGFSVPVTRVQGRGTPPKAIPHRTQPQFADPPEMTPKASELPPRPDQDVFDRPTRSAPVDPSFLKTSGGRRSPFASAPPPPPPEPPPVYEEPPELVEEEPVEAPPDEALFDAPPPVETPFEEAVEAPPEEVEAAPPEIALSPVPVHEEPVEAPPAEEPASEECDEATFFLEQGLLDEAREILETVLIAYPDHQRAAQLMAQLEAATTGPSDSPAAEAPAGGNGVAPEGERDAFDLAQELANELGDSGAGPEAAAAPAAGDGEYQVSVEEVFSEFKKGLEKVVKPEDVDTHYDLGIAYKEMGLLDDAVSEFSVARKGCIGKRKEIDCLTMIGLMHIMKGDSTSAIDAFTQALASEHAVGDVEKAARFELASAYEGAGQHGRALAQFQKVQALDATFRDVGPIVERLAAIAVPEETPAAVPIASKKKGDGGGGSGAPSRKVGYV